MALVWNESLSVGYGLIDEQHKELFQRYNELLDACKNRRGREVISSTLDFLMEYVTEHFSEEERSMQQYDYPGRDEHIRQHRELFEHVKDVYDELESEGATVAVITSISHTILNWLLRHVRQTDVELGRFLAQNAA